MTWKQYAVITTHNRQASCTNLVGQLVADDVEVVVIDNASSPRFHSDLAYVIGNSNQPPNLSQLWNIGLHAVNFLHFGKHRLFSDYAVTVFNDDISIPEGYTERMATALELYDVDIAFPDQFGIGTDVVNRSAPGTCLDLMRRVTGYAFTLRGSAQLYADESLRWWYGDDDLEMQARARRGTVLVGGVTVEHSDANGNHIRRPELQEQACLDRATFVEKHGFQPW